MSTEARDTAPTEETPEDRYLAMQRSPEFGNLRKSFRGFVFPMTVAFFVWYALYVILSAYARDFMSIRIGGSHINVALIFGLLQFVSTFLIAWLYARYANRKVDPLADQINEELGEVSRDESPRG